MLTLFILKSGSLDADPKKTLDSFNGVKNLVGQAALLNSLSEINAAEKQRDWYFVIYDDEIVGDGLMRVPLEKDGQVRTYCPLKVHLRNTQADVLILFKKKDGVVSQSPRVFRKHVKLSDTLLPADKTVRFDKVLDGWIKG